jgi:hypothetical protein
MWEKLTRRPIGIVPIICCLLLAVVIPAWGSFTVISSQLRPGETVLQADVLDIDQREHSGRYSHPITCVYQVQLEDKRTYQLTDQNKCIAGIGEQVAIAESDTGEVRIYNPASWTAIIPVLPFTLAGIFGLIVGIAARQRAIREGRDPQWGDLPEAKED